MNKCTFCQKEKQDLCLHRRVTYKGSVYNYYVCKECNSNRAKKYRKTKRGKFVYAKIRKKQQLTHKSEYIARYKLKYAIKSGKIYKPTNCSLCKKEQPIEGHHPDHTKPFEVVWLCRPCHKIVEKYVDLSTQSVILNK